MRFSGISYYTKIWRHNVGVSKTIQVDIFVCFLNLNTILLMSYLHFFLHFPVSVDDCYYLSLSPTKWKYVEIYGLPCRTLITVLSLQITNCTIWLNLIKRNKKMFKKRITCSFFLQFFKCQLSNLTMIKPSYPK